MFPPSVKLYIISFEMLHDACAKTHGIANFRSGFVSRAALKALLLEHVGNGYANAVCASLCDLPGVNGTVHCHCEDPYSLQCQARQRVLQSLFNDRHFRLLRVPYFYCCSRFVVFRFQRRLYIKIRSRYRPEGEALLSEMGLQPTRYTLRHGVMCVLEVECEPATMAIVTNLLHQRINLNPSDPAGYHFGTWEGWKDEATDMFEGRYCRVRFIDISGGSYQERYLIKQCDESEGEGEAALRMIEMPPPERLPNGRWRCFYAPGFCQCTVPCQCPSAYAYADLTPYFVERYARDLTRVPHALKVYVQFYASVML